LEESLTLDPPDFQPVGPVTFERTISIPDCCGTSAYYRVRLLP
jgi:hypothetical protein